MPKRKKKGLEQPIQDRSSKQYNNSAFPALSKAELWRKCKIIALNCDLKNAVRDRIKALGYAGSPKPVEANILMITSRLLSRPMNGANISQSSSGKTKALDTALVFFPRSAYYKIDAGSERILIYTEESFEHKMVIFSEADSLPEEGPGAAALRAIISDNKMCYEYVAKSKKKGDELFTTKRIEKQGPTGCITTSTKSLPKQVGTRMLVMTVDDSPEQTRAILRAIADEENAIFTTPDMTDFIAYQQYLEGYGNRIVIIPIAHELADFVPAEQVRMRRDFRQLLSAIKASAVLHQYQRQTDECGRIIATCADYQYAVEIFGALFGELATDSVPQHIRETVEAVKELTEYSTPCSTAQLMEKLNVKSRSTINDRVKHALAAELLINQRVGKGPYELLPGRPLPEERPILPSIEDITTCHGIGGCIFHLETDRTAVQAASSVLSSAQNQQEQALLQDVRELFEDPMDQPIENMPLF